MLPDRYQELAGAARGAVRAPRERAQEKRDEKLAPVREQVESRSLGIREMTDQGCRRYAARAPQLSRPGRR